jgi:hypothetical protein
MEALPNSKFGSYNLVGLPFWGFNPEAFNFSYHEKEKVKEKQV